MKKFTITVKDDRATPEILTKWAKEAKNNIALKIMVGALDQQEDRYIIALIGILGESEIQEVKQ